MDAYTCSVGDLPTGIPQMLTSLAWEMLLELPTEARGLEGGRSNGGAGLKAVEATGPAKPAR